MYIAKHYVRVNGKMYTKGETITDELSADKAMWLVEAGAIEEVAPGLAAVRPETEAAMQPEQTAAQEAEPTEEAPEEEVDEEAEAPEIDVMAGIVAGGQEEAPKKTTRKTAAKKTTERRKSK